MALVCSLRLATRRSVRCCISALMRALHRRSISGPGKAGPPTRAGFDPTLSLRYLTSLVQLFHRLVIRTDGSLESSSFRPHERRDVIFLRASVGGIWYSCPPLSSYNLLFRASVDGTWCSCPPLSACKLPLRSSEEGTWCSCSPLSAVEL